MTSLRTQLTKFSIEEIKAELNDGWAAKDIYLKKGEDVLGLHMTGMFTDKGIIPMEAWANAYNSTFKYLGSIYRIFGPIEEEAEALKEDGWVEIEGPTETA